MSLGTKLFAAVLALLLVMLSAILWLIDRQVEQREVARISAELDQTRERFGQRLHRQQNSNQRLLETITQDQKYRSFLHQIKDNYFAFTEEIAKTLESDLVFMSDEGSHIRALYPPNTDAQAWLEQNLDQLLLSTVLDHGRSLAILAGSGNLLVSAVSVPLKESLNDDYAMGAITAANRINDAWLQRLLGNETTNSVIIFNADVVIAATGIDGADRAALLEQYRAKPGIWFSAKGQRLIGREVYLQGQFGYLLLANLDDALAPFRALQRQILLYGFVTACGGLLLSLLIARRIVRPIQSLVQGTQAISNGRYDYHIDYRSKDEIGQLATAFNRMTSGLREKEFIRSTFNRYLNPNIIDRILADPQQLQLGGERQRQTMLFSDLVNFTQICEQMPPVQLIGLLNDYLSAMTEIVDNHQGIVDKYIGDAIMAYWGPLSTGADHASQACLAAHTMRLRLNELQQQWRERGLPILQIRIGIATGEMIVGNIGSEQNCNYTCIGDTVNICSRLESTNKLYGTDILVDHDTAKEAQGLLFRELDSIQVKGREGSMAVFALIRPDDQALTNTESSLLAGYAKALQLYYTGDFATAQSAFEQLAQRWPTDTATQAMLKRCLELKNTPPADWRGVYKIQVK